MKYIGKYYTYCTFLKSTKSFTSSTIIKKNSQVKKDCDKLLLPKSRQTLKFFKSLLFNLEMMLNKIKKTFIFDLKKH